MNLTFERIVTGLLLVALLAYALTGFFMRPESDDLFLISLTHQHGILGVLTQQYYEWQGRYGTVLVNAAGLSFGALASQWMPVLLIVLLLGVLHRICRLYVNNPLLAAAGILLAFIAGLPNLWQSLYWFGSSSNYVLPLALGGCVFLWVSR